MPSQSELVDTLARLIEFVRGHPLKAKRRSALVELVGDHLVDAEAPEWMLVFLEDVLSGRAARTHIPTGYPMGENGLANILADIEVGMGMKLGIEDYGEGVHWKIPRHGIVVFICREALARDQHFYEVSSDSRVSLD